MNNKLAAFLFALPALVVITAFKVITVAKTIMISLENYDVIEGVNRGGSAGILNYIALFQNDLFTGVMKNTIILGLLSLLFTCVLAVFLILCISRMPNWIMKTIAILIIAVPAFIPSTSFVSVFMDLFSMNGSINSILSYFGAEPSLFFADQGLYPFLLAMMDAIKNVYIPVIIGVLVCETRGRKSGAGRICLAILGYIAARAMMLLSPDVESVMLTSNPLVRGNSEVIDTFVYRVGLQNMEMSLASASWVVKSFLQLVITAVVFLFIYLIMPYITDAAGSLGENKSTVGGSIVGTLGFILFGTASAIMIYLTFSPAGGGLAGVEAILRDDWFYNSLTLGLASSLIYGLLSLLLAYPLRYSKMLYPLFLVIIFSLSNNFIGEYLLYKDLNIIGTIYPVVISSSLSVVGAFALHFSISCKLKGASYSFMHYLKLSIAPLIVIVVLAFIANWGSYLYQTLFIQDASMQTLNSYGYQLMMSPDTMGTDTVGGVQLSAGDIRTAVIFISSIVPAVLGALLIILNKFLPLTAFTANLRKS